MSSLHLKQAAVPLVVILMSGLALGSPKPRVNPRAQLLKEFSDRVDAYVGVHKKADGDVPSLKKTDDPAEISSREKLLGQAIAALRKDARQGDIFFPRIAADFRRIIRRDLAERGSRTTQAALIEVPTEYVPKVNALYPTAKPLATMPPKMLLKLQRLPEQVEYRFLGRYLILRDVKANLIIDFVPNVIPPGSLSHD